VGGPTTTQVGVKAEAATVDLAHSFPDAVAYNGLGRSRRDVDRWP